MKDKERKRLWELVTARDGKKCAICKKAPATALDHIWPRALGGTDDIYNLQPACKPCNSRKRAKIPAVLPLFVEGDPWALRSTDRPRPSGARWSSLHLVEHTSTGHRCDLVGRARDRATARLSAADGAGVAYPWEDA